jgi:ATP-binding cassette subfamily C (CFTR/MRP) protein 1
LSKADGFPQATPFFAILILPMAYVCRQLQQYYIRTTRELARMDSATKSPIFSHFQESLGGMASIRAYKREEAFARENINRIEANLRAFMCFTTTNRWVMIRLELIAAIVGTYFALSLSEAY